jgi:hypothetical protein
MRRKSASYKILVGESEGKRILLKFRSTWKGNIKMDLQEIGLENVLDSSG